MGQAVVDLPDPTQKQSNSARSADDLLSQLAGDEIDRLLTEADAHPADAEPEPLIDPAIMAKNAAADASGKSGIRLTGESPAAPAAGLSADRAAAELDALLDSAADASTDRSADAAKHPPCEAAASAGGRSAENAAAELDALLGSATDAVAETIKHKGPEAADIAMADALAPAGGMTADSTAAELDALLGSAMDESADAAAPTAHAKEAEPALTGAALDHAVAAEAEKILAPQTAEARAEAAAVTAHAAAAAAEQKVSHDEREELLATVAAEAKDDRDTVAPLPLLLRPLEWLSAPLDELSDAFREFLGKAALVTLVNSAAVIAYVMIFRRHH